MRKADNLPASCSVVTKSGNLNFLELSGPLRARNGTALPLPFTIKIFKVYVQQDLLNKEIYCNLSNVDYNLNETNLENSAVFSDSPHVHVTQEHTCKPW